MGRSTFACLLALPFVALGACGDDAVPGGGDTDAGSTTTGANTTDTGQPPSTSGTTGGGTETSTGPGAEDSGASSSSGGESSSSGGDSTSSSSTGGPNADSDGDGIPDYAELFLGYDPDDADSDDDSLLDGVEDPDWDGPSPGETAVLDPDTDDDGHCDAARVDNDGDGLDPHDPCDGQEVIYLDADAAAGGDGQSWGTAFTTLDEIAAEPGQQVWVAEGVYRASVGLSAFDVPAQVTLYGGFDGTEATANDRPDPLPESILSADVAGDDISGDAFINRGDNTAHVLTVGDGASVQDIVLEGGTALGADADGEGGGARIAPMATASFAGVTFRENRANFGRDLHVSPDATAALEGCTLGTSIAPEAAVWGASGSSTSVTELRASDVASTFAVDQGTLDISASRLQDSVLLNAWGATVTLDDVLVEGALQGNAITVTDSSLTADALGISHSGLNGIQSDSSIIDLRNSACAHVANIGSFCLNNESALPSDVSYENVANVGVGVLGNFGEITIQRATFEDVITFVVYEGAALELRDVDLRGTSNLQTESFRVEWVNVSLQDVIAGNVFATWFEAENLTLTSFTQVLEYTTGYMRNVVVVGPVIWGANADVTDACTNSVIPPTGSNIILLDDSSAGGITYSSDPFDPGPGGELFLKHAGVNGQVDTSACVDAGQYHNYVEDGLTTRHDEVVDGDSPDLGRRYHPDRAKAALTADDTEVTWSVQDASFCLLFNDADGSIVRLDDPGDDSMDHGHASGTELTLACFGDVDAPPVLQAQIP